MRVWLRTFGCRANQYDTEAVREVLEGSGHEVVATPSDADVAVFNSCAVTTDAVADLRQAIRRANREQPSLRNIVMGCASALPEADALRVLPGVTDVIAGADLSGVAAALGATPPAGIRTRQQAGARALLRIQDGCDEHCTFCATTIARGANRSRAVDEIVAEARELARWHPEIVITGVHIGGWGREHDSTLGALVERLVLEVPHVRFRLTSIEATEVDDRLAELLTGARDRVAPHLHAPLQSGSDRMLRRMGRHWYTASRYAEAVERLAARAAVFALSGDVITGFPGESEDDHAATMALVGALPFTSLHVFPYSERPGTAASRLPERVPPRLSRARAAELRDLGAAKAQAHRRGRVGAAADVVVIGQGAARRGLTEDYLDVAIADAPRPARFSAKLVDHGGELTAEAAGAVSG